MLRRRIACKIADANMHPKRPYLLNLCKIFLSTGVNQSQHMNVVVQARPDPAGRCSVLLPCLHKRTDETLCFQCPIPGAEMCSGASYFSLFLESSAICGCQLTCRASPVRFHLRETSSRLLSSLLNSMASGYCTCAEGTPDLMGAVSVNGDGGPRGGLGVYVPLEFCEANTPVLFLMCKNAPVLLNHRSYCEEVWKMQTNIPL